MKIKIYREVNTYDEFDLYITQVREVIAGLILHKGEEYANNISNGNYKYILVSNNSDIQPLALSPAVILSDISFYNTLLIIPEVSGEVPAAAVAGMLYGAATAAAVTAGTAALTATIVSYAVAAIINIAISMALNMVMSLLSPTKEFSSDPSQSQNRSSSLFNGAPLIREQGGSVPLAFGEGFAGGVLISASLTTVEG